MRIAATHLFTYYEEHWFSEAIEGDFPHLEDRLSTTQRLRQLFAALGQLSCLETSKLTDVFSSTGIPGDLADEELIPLPRLRRLYIRDNADHIEWLVDHLTSVTMSRSDFTYVRQNFLLPRPFQPQRTYAYLIH